jgi:ATP-dependent DNA helicase DinG
LFLKAKKSKIPIEPFFAEQLRQKPGMKVREPQIELALEIEDAIIRGKKFIGEAEVGTGKSFAYLIPVINEIIRTEKPGLISTGTIVLQDQLVKRDIPALSKYLNEFGYLDQDIVVYLGKGKEQYMCPQNLDKEIANAIEKELDFTEFIPLDAGLKLGKYDRSDFPDVGIDTWKKVCVMGCSGKCKERGCAYKLYKNQRSLKSYHILVCNHHYLLSCLKDPAFSISSFGTVIIDEAHNLESIAQSIYGISGNEQSFQSKLKQLIAMARSRGMYRKADANSILKYNKSFFRKIKEAALTRDEFEVEQRYKVDIDAKIQEMAQELFRKADRLCDQASIALEFSKSKSEQDKIDRIYDGIYRMLSKIIEYKDNNIFWVDVSRKNGAIQINAVPKNIDEILFRKLFSVNVPVILTSATMSTETSTEGFDYFASGIGIDLIPLPHYKDPVSKKSPYDFSKQAGIYIEQELQYVRKGEAGQALYMQKKADKIFDIIQVTNGKALVLFTSYTAMDTTYSLIAEKISQQMGIKCYKQGMGSRDRLLEEFSRDINACLFATGSFWEGIDVKGPALSCVIIDKLPFPVMDPVLEHKVEKMNISEQDIIRLDMIIKLKQGAGRLIRDETDTGVLAIMDSRASRRYSGLIMDNLPSFKVLKNINEIAPFIGGFKQVV